MIDSIILFENIKETVYLVIGKVLYISCPKMYL